MAPPDFPQPEHYRPLGTLLQGIKRGQRFHPLTVADIRSEGCSTSYLLQAYGIATKHGVDAVASIDRPEFHSLDQQYAAASAAAPACSAFWMCVCTEDSRTVMSYMSVLSKGVRNDLREATRSTPPSEGACARPSCPQQALKKAKRRSGASRCPSGRRLQPEVPFCLLLVD